MLLKTPGRRATKPLFTPAILPFLFIWIITQAIMIAWQNAPTISATLQI